MFESRILGGLCLLVLCGILWAGLWPFHSPVNDVTWVGTGEGIRIGHYGTVLSSGVFTSQTSQDSGEAAGTIEIWLRPLRNTTSGTILAFYTPGHTRQFALYQFHETLGLQTRGQSERLYARDAELVYVGDVFDANRSTLITITSGRQGASVYLDGILTTTSTPFWLSIKDFTGRLVLGTSPEENHNWSGQLLGLAIYGNQLTPAQISRHFEDWTTHGRPDDRDEHARALYLFNERQGRTVHDHGGSAIDLQIPERYSILNEKFLEPFWEEFHPVWGYWKSVAINIAGFVPLGFFFCAYLSRVKLTGRPALATILCGAGVSITIEILQSLLPTRDSGTTDIFTNTLGTALGVGLYFSLMARSTSRVAATRRY